MLFDKTPEANWALGWHQDQTIAVRAQAPVEGFGPWTQKAGVTHGTAPAWLMERMVNVRVHLDPCGLDAGPLKVLPGTHRLGRLSHVRIDELKASHAEVACVAEVGDVLAFKPLLLHASSSSDAPRRRVLQLEFAAESLPDGLEWNWRV